MVSLYCANCANTIGPTQIQISATDLSRTQQHKVLKLNTFSWSTEVKRHLLLCRNAALLVQIQSHVRQIQMHNRTNTH